MISVLSTPGEAHLGCQTPAARIRLKSKCLLGSPAAGTAGPVDGAVVIADMLADGFCQGGCTENLRAEWSLGSPV